MSQISVTFTINGIERSVYCAANRTLLDVLRDEFHLTGVKDACGGEGECGACTVIMDGKPVNSCLVLIGQARDKNIETIEGLSDNGKLHPIQKAFLDAGAVQCGFCTPGIIMSVKALLSKKPDPKEDEIKEALSGHLCRCTGYIQMIEAVKLAGKEMRAKVAK